VRAFEVKIPLNSSLTYKIDFNLCALERNRALLEVENVQLFFVAREDNYSQPIGAS